MKTFHHKIIHWFKMQQFTNEARKRVSKSMILTMLIFGFITLKRILWSRQTTKCLCMIFMVMMAYSLT